MMHEIRTPANEIRRQCHPRRAVRMPIGAVRIALHPTLPGRSRQVIRSTTTIRTYHTAAQPPPGTRSAAGRTSAFPIKKKGVQKGVQGGLHGGGACQPCCARGGGAARRAGRFGQGGAVDVRRAARGRPQPRRAAARQPSAAAACTLLEVIPLTAAGAPEDCAGAPRGRRPALLPRGHGTCRAIEATAPACARAASGGGALLWCGCFVRAPACARLGRLPPAPAALLTNALRRPPPVAMRGEAQARGCVLLRRDDRQLLLRRGQPHEGAAAARVSKLFAIVSLAASAPSANAAAAEPPPLCERARRIQRHARRRGNAREPCALLATLDAAEHCESPGDLRRVSVNHSQRRDHAPHHTSHIHHTAHGNNCKRGTHRASAPQAPQRAPRRDNLCRFRRLGFDVGRACRMF